MKPILDKIEAQLEVCEKATPGPWDDKPANEDWLANGPANYGFCRQARTGYPAALRALKIAIEAMGDANCHCGRTFAGFPNCAECERTKALAAIEKELG